MTWPADPLPFPTAHYWAPRVRFDPDLRAFLLDAPGLGLVKPELYGTVLPQTSPSPGEIEGIGSEGSRFKHLTGWGERYLALYALDLDDDEAVIGFVEENAILGMRFGTRYVGGPHMLRKQGFADILAYLSAFGTFDDLTDLPGETEVRREAERMAIPDAFAEALAALMESGARDVIVLETLEDFRIGARQLRDLVRAWRVTSGQASPESMLDRWETPSLWPEPGEVRALFPDPLDPTESARLLSAGLCEGTNAPLTAFTPQVLVYEPFAGAQTPPLFNMLGLELFNHVVEGAPYRTCANEPCGRLFRRQSGRAVHGQHRTRGVKYCSADCARAQAQRQYRRRKASP